MVRPIFLVKSLATGLLAGAALAATPAPSVPVMVRNIGTKVTALGSYPQFLTTAGARTFFFAGTEAYGSELWVTDGTAEGTTFVKDIYSGPKSSCQYTKMTAFQGEAFFLANDREHGTQLWKSDGTTAGTMMVKDLSPGSSVFSPLVVAADRLFFFSAPSGGSSKLWMTDGTEAGTTQANIDGNTSASRLQPQAAPLILRSLSPATSRFVVLYTNTGTYITDGTALGTRRISPFGVSEIRRPGTTVPFGSGAIIGAEMELYRIDADGNATLLKTFADQFGYKSMPHNLTVVGNTVFFEAGDGTYNWDLWKTDGTAAGTQRVKELGRTSEGSLIEGTRPEMFTVLGNRLLFTAYAGGARRLWTSDGMEAGTFPLTESVEIEYPSIRTEAPAAVAAAGGLAYFPGSMGLNKGQYEVWRTDGTKEGTQKLVTGTGGAFVPLGNRVVYVDRDPVAGWEPFISDGTPAGTHVLRDINVGDSGSSPVGLTPAFGGLAFFSTNDTGFTLWRTDGTEAGTRPLKAVDPTSFAPTVLGECGGVLYFHSCGPGSCGVWRSDGTPAGTFLLESVNFTSGVCAGDSLLYLIPRSFQPSLLKKTGGSTASTSVLSAEVPHESRIVAVPGGGLIAGSPWMRTNGTPAGTAPFNAIPSGSSVEFVTSSGGVTWLLVRQGTSAMQLYRTDGTESGTEQLHSWTSYPSTTLLGAVDGILYFRAGGAMWRSDGTIAGTRILPGAPYTDTDVVSIGGAHYYYGYSSADGFGFSRIDPSSGTVTIVPRTGDIPRAYVQDLTAAGSWMFLTAPYFPQNGDTMPTQIWVSDGTESGTRILGRFLFQDGPRPSHLTVAGGRLYFTANTRSGVELWAVELTNSRVLRPVHR